MYEAVFGWSHDNTVDPAQSSALSRGYSSRWTTAAGIQAPLSQSGYYPIARTPDVGSLPVRMVTAAI